VAVALVKLGPVDTSGLSPAFGQPTTAGDLLVAWLISSDSSATDPFSTISPGWSAAFAAGSSSQWTSVWYKPDCAAGETAPVFTSANGGPSLISMLGEFSGAALSSPVDSSGTSASPAAACAAPDSAGGDLIIFSVCWNSGNGGGTITTTMTDSAGSAVTPGAAAGVAGTWIYYGFAWGIAGAATGTGKDTAAGTLSVSGGAASGIVSFKAAPAAPAFTFGTPYAGWNAGIPYTGWDAGTPYTGWSTGTPGTG
jgi:hypothetical protein